MIIPCPNCDGDKGHHIPQHVTDGELVPAEWVDCRMCSGEGKIEATSSEVLMEHFMLMAEAKADSQFHELRQMRLMQTAVGTVAAAIRAGDPQALHMLEEMLNGFVLAQVRTADEAEQIRRN